MTTTDARSTAVVAEAPGKLLWLGEYAVLDGAPAVVCSVDRQVRTTLLPSADGRSRMHAANLRVAPLEFEHAAQQIVWISRPEELELAARVIDAAFERGLLGHMPPFEAQVDSGAFFSGQHKVGIGSSAAVATALYRALLGQAGQPLPAPAEAFDLLDTLHREYQSGRGSGVDVAAAVFGGLLEFGRAANGEAPRVARLPVPDNLHWCAVFCGRSASTAGYLAQLDEARAQTPRRIDALLVALAELSRRGCAALRAQDAAAFVDLIAPFADALAKLGEAAQLDIVSREHRELARIAAAHRVVYKSSGAGGGDLGVGFACDAGAIAQFRAAASQEGFSPLGLGMAGAAHWTTS